MGNAFYSGNNRKLSPDRPFGIFLSKRKTFYLGYF